MKKWVLRLLAIIAAAVILLALSFAVPLKKPEIVSMPAPEAERIPTIRLAELENITDFTNNPSTISANWPTAGQGGNYAKFSEYLLFPKHVRVSQQQISEAVRWPTQEEPYAPSLSTFYIECRFAFLLKLVIDLLVSDKSRIPNFDVVEVQPLQDARFDVGYIAHVTTTADEPLAMYILAAKDNQIFYVEYFQGRVQEAVVLDAIAQVLEREAA